MAIDKAVDSSVLDAGLTKIADAIREKAGTSDTMEFPDGFAELIAGIQAGNEALVATGSTTLAESTTNITAEHNLGVLPNLFMCAIDNGVHTEEHNVNLIYYLCRDITDIDSYTAVWCRTNSAGIATYAKATNDDAPVTVAFSKGKNVTLREVNETKARFFGYFSSTSAAQFPAGGTYTWVIARVNI